MILYRIFGLFVCNQLTCLFDLVYDALQATIMVYQAIAEYWVGAREEEYDVNLELILPDRSKFPRVKLTRENHYITKSAKVRCNQ